MIDEIQIRVTPRVSSDLDRIVHFISSERHLPKERICGARILKRSIDARQRNVMVNLKVRVYIDEPMTDDYLIPPIAYKPVDSDKVAIVVGAGPGGLFAALRLIELGVKPIVLERGKDVVERRKDVARISRDGTVDPDSNYCFGEGGAGAYSDGKLYTRSKKRGSVERILGIFVQHGASENILIDTHPHIGSDRLPKIIEQMRNTIIKCGGEVHFKTRVRSLIIDNDTVTGVDCESGEKFSGPVILATGHSARDVYRMLYDKKIGLEAKGIAVGVRLEHPQHIIDQIQYHSPEGRGQYLPAAEYNFVTQVEGRGVYSFCMCPGGVIVPAASGPNQLVVNGMSPSHRNTYWANSGMVVEVRPEDLPEKYDNDGVLSMMHFQEDLERTCFEQAGNSQVAGAQRMKDFVEGKPSKLIPPSSYSAGLQPSRLDQWLPSFIADRLRKGFQTFGHAAKGFLSNDAIVIGVETRTSSPVRIPRDSETLHHIKVKGLYPCGEGAGYAGGIVSAAIDGERCAEALVNDIKNS
ncbi:MAG: FAD-dependent monooxygenase [Muribaculaceae bacterium]|nr:FAD-dependent monooxygenase [Muribaculaceae bacterium]